MIEIHETKLGQSVKMTELYDYLELTPTYYSRWIQNEVLDNPYLTDNQDYCTAVQVLGVGRRRKEFYIHIDAAKKLCMVSKSSKGNQVRHELVELTKKVENASLVSHTDVMIIMKMIKVFSIYEYRALALNKNKDNFAN